MKLWLHPKRMGLLCGELLRARRWKGSPFSSPLHSLLFGDAFLDRVCLIGLRSGIPFAPIVSISFLKLLHGKRSSQSISCGLGVSEVSVDKLSSCGNPMYIDLEGVTVLGDGSLEALPNFGDLKASFFIVIQWRTLSAD